jgi:molybdopterin biosynthesis enzyme MoaB
MKSRIDIRVSGPGSTIHCEIAVIHKALKEAGFNVCVVDSHPCPDDYNPLNEKAMELARENKVICIIADHQPWGG